MSGESTVAVRLADLNDLELVVDLHMASFSADEHVPVALGTRYVAANYRWLISSPDAYVLVAQSFGRVIGLVAVCDRPFTRPMFIACLGEFSRSILMRPSLVFRANLWKRLFRGAQTSPRGREIARYPGVAQMTIGAVDASARGAGVFPALVGATRQVSEARGSRAVYAGIYKSNWPSRRVFVKGGWAEIPELETPETVFYITYLDLSIEKELGASTELGDFV